MCSEAAFYVNQRWVLRKYGREISLNMEKLSNDSLSMAKADEDVSTRIACDRWKAE